LVAASAATLAYLETQGDIDMPTLTETVREIALNQPSSIRVFEQFGIDYCCGGRKPLALACNEQNVSLEEVLNALASAVAISAPDARDWANASLQELSQHIVLRHHEYVRRELPRLAALSVKVITQHAGRPELGEIQATLSTLDQELTQHLAKEELVLFPYIAEFESALASGGIKPSGCFGTVANPIAMMTQEHEAAGELLASLRSLSGNFTAPADACPTYRAFYAGLREFEQDLHQHIHLENNILFPRAIAMESSASQSRG
jgi:regulator of cell morphogenesis and NO signaling